MAVTRKFNLYLTGHALAGHERAAAAAALARLVHLTETQAAGLLAGRETLVKRDLGEAQATAYLSALEQAGVGARKEEIPAAEAPPPADPAPAVETIACPACGTVQPKRTLCRQCGADMPRMIAAREEATRQPSPKRPKNEATAAPVPEASEELPAYRRSRLFEVLLFLFATMLWGYFAMTDRQRGPAMRVFGGTMFVVFGIGALGYFYGFFSGDDNRREAIHNAHFYAAQIADRVGEYALANQALPEDGAAIALPPGPPGGVESVSVGPAGRVRVTLKGELSAGGSITYSPYVEGQKLMWACEAENIATKFISKNCG